TVVASGTRNVVLLGGVQAASGTPALTIAGLFSSLTTPTGALLKTQASTVLNDSATLVIDSDRSLGTVPGAAATNLTVNSSTLEVQPGTASTMTLSANRKITIGGNKAPVFNVPGGLLTGDSTLVIPGII